jgi:hypothetical protein
MEAVFRKDQAHRKILARNRVDPGNGSIPLIFLLARLPACRPRRQVIDFWL